MNAILLGRECTENISVSPPGKVFLDVGTDLYTFE